MRQLFFVACLISMAPSTAGGQPVSDDPTQASRQRLDRLLEQYKAYGLPLPPPDAKLVRYCWRPVIDSQGQLSPRRFGLAFQPKPVTRKAGGDLLRGLERLETMHLERIEDVMPRPESVEQIDQSTISLVLAIQCHDREWFQLAERLFEASREFKEKATASHLAHQAWDHWLRDLTEPKSDWQNTARRLKNIIEREPKAFEKRHRDLIHSMELSLKPSKAKVGSIEALLEEFIPSDAVYIHQKHNIWLPELTEDPRFDKIASQGFVAIPSLLGHLDDERLTRTRDHRCGLNNWRPNPYPYRIQHIASWIILELSGLSPQAQWHDGTDYMIPPKVANDWWKEAREIGEEKYLLGRVRAVRHTARGQMLGIIAQKYPKHLAGLYREVLARSSSDYGEMAGAVGTSNLPIEQKRALLLEGAGNKVLAHRTEALVCLKDVDESAFERMMIATLDALPKSSEEHLDDVLHLAQRAAGGKVWEALDRATRRADPFDRVKYLESMRPQYDDDEAIVAKKLKLLVRFLDDRMERKLTPEQVDGDFVIAAQFVRLEIRNFAAWKIAELVEDPIEPQRGWKDDQWAAFRARAKTAAEKATSK